MIESPDYALYPHAQVVRLFYSVGIIGSFIFLLAFYYPVAQIAKFTNNKIWIYLILILLGSTLAHRSVVLLIFFGVFLAVFRQFSKKNSGLKK